MSEHIFSMAADFTELKLDHRCLAVNFMKIFRKDILENTSVLFLNEISYGKTICFFNPSRPNPG